MKYSSITTAVNTYAVFVNRTNAEDIEATIVSAWALTETGATVALMPSQQEEDPQLVAVEDSEKRLFKTFYFGNDPVNYMQNFQVKMRMDAQDGQEKAVAATEFHEPEVF